MDFMVYVIDRWYLRILLRSLLKHVFILFVLPTTIRFDENS